MKRLKYIEDYIELMARHVLSWPVQDPVVNLARYDEPIVSSMSDQIQRGVGFSDRQAVLAHKIVTKYRKQWNAKQYCVDHLVQQPEYRIPIRAIDRRRVIDIGDTGIEIRFPYDQELIAKVRAVINTIPGSLRFDQERRAWIAALIEPRLIWAKQFGSEHGFEFGAEFQAAVAAMLAQPDYAICLQPAAEGFSITNAADSLCDYVMQHGGFGQDNLLGLIDLSGVLGFSVDPKVYESVDTDLDTQLIQLLTQRDTNLIYDTRIDLAPVVRYAELTKRWPMYVYESGHTQLHEQLSRYFAPEHIADRRASSRSQQQGRVIYFNHWKLADAHMPLLVTSHTLMIGNRRQQMLQSADKIVYFSQRIQDDDTV